MTDTQFQAMVVREDAEGNFERCIETRTVDDLPAGEVLVHVSFSSLNYKDALSATGNRGVTRHYPHTPGIDAAGIVVESSAAEIAPGQSVLVTGFDLGMNTDGGYGQLIRVPADWIVPLPEPLSFKDAMAFGTAGLTAALSILKLVDHGIAPHRGEILVTGASGGVGSMAVAILSQIGYRVVAVSGKADAIEFLTGLGAREVIPRHQATDDSGKPLLKGRWAGVVDIVGGEILATALKSTRSGAVVTCCGMVDSPRFETTVFPFILRGVSLFGIDSAGCDMGTRKRAWENLSGPWRIDALDTLVREVPLDQLDTEIDRILAGLQKGRVVVRL